MAGRGVLELVNDRPSTRRLFGEVLGGVVGTELGARGRDSAEDLARGRCAVRTLMRKFHSKGPRVREMLAGNRTRSSFVRRDL
jgi:hypothetical protein